MNELTSPTEEPNSALLLGIAAALLVSVALVWFVTETLLVTIAFAAGLVVLLLAAWILNGMKAAPEAEQVALPDWSVTVTAIEGAGGDKAVSGVAITDRANRLVCANTTFTDWFGIADAPPNLPLSRASQEALVRTAREGWRDGTATAPELAMEAGEPRWNASATRAGRGEDYLIWRFIRDEADDQYANLAQRIAGPLGAMLSRAGIESAVTMPDGSVRAVSRGFAERASGDAGATMAGQDFVVLLRSDDRDRIYFAREGRRGSPQTLVHVPLNDPAVPDARGPDEAPSLMLLLDSGIGLGGGETSGDAATPQLEALLGALPLGLAMTDRDGRFLFANDAFLRAIDREAKGLPQYPSDLTIREDKSALSDAVRRYGRGPAASGDMAVRLTGQPDDPVSLGLAGVRGLGDASVLLSLVDSTEETRLKHQVAQATKMQAVGQLAGGVAHDFNNVLTAIIGYCDLMLLRHTPGDSDYDDIQQIRANSNRAASLTRQLLAFSRQQTLRPEVLQLPDVVSEVSQLLKRLVGEKITFNIRHDRDLGPVRADPQQLEQVIVNLAVNARDAINARLLKKPNIPGKLTLATRRVTTGDITAMGSDILPSADYTVMIVQDNGGGIPAGVLGKIFEPFFTTKELGKGTGLGLSTVYGIVKQSGGFIFADNVTDHLGEPTGARFTIYLPVHHATTEDRQADSRRADAANKPPEPASDWSGGGRILLVEDEDMVRAVAERALTRAGYTVTACADGEEGLAAVANGGQFDLVVSDVVMPVMDGPAMARAIRRVKPDLPLLFMSGYAEEQLRSDIDIPGMDFLPKPFSVQQIGDKVARILAATAKRSAD